jgi:hypothetical protein
MNMKMPNLKRTILLIGAPAILVGTGLTTMAASAATPTATPSQQTQPSAEPSESAAETAESTSAAEAAAEANEPALPGGGHADAAGQNVDSQFEGVQ